MKIFQPREYSVIWWILITLFIPFCAVIEYRKQYFACSTALFFLLLMLSIPYSLMTLLALSMLVTYSVVCIGINMLLLLGWVFDTWTRFKETRT